MRTRDGHQASCPDGISPAGGDRLEDVPIEGISELTILPDGRLYVLGVSPAVLELLQSARLWRESSAPAVSREPFGFAGRCGEGDEEEVG